MARTPQCEFIEFYEKTTLLPHLRIALDSIWSRDKLFGLDEDSTILAPLACMKVQIQPGVSLASRMLSWRLSILISLLSTVTHHHLRSFKVRCVQHRWLRVTHLHHVVLVLPQEDSFLGRTFIRTHNLWLDLNQKTMTIRRPELHWVAAVPPRTPQALLGLAVDATMEPAGIS